MVTRTLPQVLEQLYALAVEHLAAEPDTAVKLGPLRADLDEMDAVGIGVDAGTEEGEPARAQTLRGIRTRRDTQDITCVAQSLNGDDDLAVAARRAFALMAEVESLLPQLVEAVGAVWEAVVATYAYRPVRTEQGALAVLEFVVRVEAMEQEHR